jgi:pyruvate/2-oxoglutarate/acetoin dehydrogenase E1 component
MAQSAPVSNSRTLTMARAGREAVIAEMRKDPNIFVIGEDIAKLGGVFGTTVGMAEEFGSNRVIDTPISETGFIGIASGAAMEGMRPIVEIAFVDFIGVCFNAIYNFAAKTHYMSGGQFKMPMTMMIGYGGGYNDAAYDAKGLMHSCLRDDNLTIWMVHKAIWGLGWLGTAIKTALAEVPLEEYTIPFGKARIWREGNDVTLVGYGITVHHSLTAAAKLAEAGISAEVLDLRSIVPMDRDEIFKSVSKTGRLIVVDEDYMNCGITAEVLAVVAERGPRVLKAPAVRIAYPDVPVPFSRPMEDFCLPLPEKIVSAARAMCQ